MTSSAVYSGLTWLFLPRVMSIQTPCEKCAHLYSRNRMVTHTGCVSVCNRCGTHSLTSSSSIFSPPPSDWEVSQSGCMSVTSFSPRSGRLYPLRCFSHLPKKELDPYHGDQAGNALASRLHKTYCTWKVRRQTSVNSLGWHDEAVFAWHKNTLCPVQLFTIPTYF